MIPNAQSKQMNNGGKYSHNEQCRLVPTVQIKLANTITMNDVKVISGKNGARPSFGR